MFLIITHNCQWVHVNTCGSCKQDQPPDTPNPHPPHPSPRPYPSTRVPQLLLTGLLHVQVHYGYASLNPVSRVPAYCVLPKLDLDIQAAGTWNSLRLVFAESAPLELLPQGSLATWTHSGQLTFNTHSWLLLDAAAHAVQRGLADGLERLLKRRYYLVERARGASMVGLLVGTLGAAGYLTALQQLRALATQAGKKTYTLLMGKPNPAKLANFPELEVFVMLSDPQGLVLECSFVSGIQAGGCDVAAKGKLPDIGRVLTRQITDIDWASFIEPQYPAPAALGLVMHQAPNAVGAAALHAGGVLSVSGSHHAKGVAAGSRTGQQVQVRSAAQYLTQHRSYRGLETPAVGADIKAAELAVKGRAGRAAGYADEPAATG
eukprot:gene10493-10653_t